MKFFDVIGFALANIRAQRLRTFLTTLTISVGGFLVFILPSLGLGVTKQIEKSLSTQDSLVSVQVSPKYDNPSGNFSTAPDGTSDYTGPKLLKALTLDDVTKIKAIDGVDSITDASLDVAPSRIAFTEPNIVIKRDSPIATSFSIVKPSDQPAIGVLPIVQEVSFKDRDFELKSGHYFVQDSSVLQIVITQKAVDQLKVQDPSILINKTVDLTFLRERVGDTQNPYETKVYTGTIVGVVAPTGQQDVLSDNIANSSTLLIPLSNAWQMNVWQAGADVASLTLNNVTVKATSIDKTDGVASKIRSELNLEAITAKEMIQDFRKGIFTMILVLASVGCIALFVGALSIVNMMMMAVTERTKEIGILRSQGASRRTIRWMFLAESGALALLGGISGVFWGWLVSLGLNYFLKVQLAHMVGGSANLFAIDSFFDYSPLFVLSVLGFVTLIGVVAGIAPAIRASRLNVVEALRYE